MKKQILFIRHATAEEPANSSMLRDFDRILNSRGTMEAVRLGKHLFAEKTKVDGIYTSPALRTAQTAQYIAEQLKIDVDLVESNESLYGGGPRGYLSLINGLPENQKSIIIVGHNPDISFFVEYLTRDDTEGDLKKGTLIIIEFEDMPWAEVSSKMGKFINRVDVNQFFDRE